MMQSKHIVRGVIFAAAALAFITAIFAGQLTSAQESKALKINLAVSDERLLIYAGSSSGIKIGQKFTVTRDGGKIATIEITESKPTYSVARVVEKSAELRDMDELIEWGKEPAAAVAASATASPGEARRGPSVVASAPAVEDKKEEAAPAATGRSRRGAEPEAEAAPAAPAAAPAAESAASSRRRGAAAAEPAAPAAEAAAAPADDSSSRRRGRGGAAAEPIGDGAPAAEQKKPDADKKVVKSPKDLSFATTGGLSGLWMNPTTDVLEKGKFAAGLYSSQYSESVSSYSYNGLPGGSGSLFYGHWMELKNETVALTYGLGHGLEAALSHTRFHGSAKVYVDGQSFNVNYDDTGRTFALKYNPQKHFLLSSTTSKKWETAFAVERIEVGDTDGSSFSGLVYFPYDKFNFHAGLYHKSMQGSVGNKMGTLAGVEMDVSPDLLFIGEMDLYKAQYSWNYAVRYIYNNKGSAMVGLSDTDDMRLLSFGLSYQF